MRPPKPDAGALVAEFNQRLVEVSAQVPASLDDPAALAAAGLPPRPAGNGPAARAWAEALGSSLRLHAVPPRPNAAGDQPPDWQIDMTSGDSRHFASNCNAAAGGGPGALMGSNNWSGAVLLANRGQRFTWITGTWRATAMDPAAAGEEECRTSVWLGFDGLFRRSRSLPQCGVTQIIPARGAEPPRYVAWFQWWERGRIVPPLEFPHFVIRPGDRLRCFLWTAGGAIGALIVNLETQEGLRLRCAPHTGKAGERTPIDGSTAAWVVERPSKLDAADPDSRAALYPVAPFGALTFEDCHAGQEGAGAGVLRNLTAARYVRMRALNPAAAPESRIVSAPQPPSGTGEADKARVTLICHPRNPEGAVPVA